MSNELLPRRAYFLIWWGKIDASVLLPARR